MLGGTLAATGEDLLVPSDFKPVIPSTMSCAIARESLRLPPHYVRRIVGREGEIAELVDVAPFSLSSGAPATGTELLRRQ